MKKNPAAEWAANLMGLYEADRPDGLPVEIPFLKEISSGSRDRPCVVAECTEERWLHPRMQEATVTISVLMRGGDEEEDESGRQWLNLVTGKLPELALPAVPDGFKLRWLMPLGNGEDVEEEGWRFSLDVGVRFLEKTGEE